MYTANISKVKFAFGVSMPLISIIIPVYNTEEFITDCLNSVLEQTFQDFEVICINDGSPDNSLAILKKFQLKDTRIKVISQQNQGVSIARNTGLSHAKGDYITFLDSDDTIAPTFLEKLYQPLKENPQANFAWGDFRETLFPFEKNEETITPRPTNINQPFDHFVKRKKPRIGASSCAKLYKKETLQNIHFPKGLTVGEDLIFLYNLLLKSNVAVYVPEVLYFYRIYKTSVSFDARK